MPEVKVKHIVSFSSEEQQHKAESLLNDDVSRKWKCEAGEKQASVVFQLEKSTQLSSIDVGNDGSAFVEILVGRSSSDNIQYKVILVASSFMSPQESRQGVSLNRVRIFDNDKLAPDVASQKWDLVKVVCTQPFNKRAAYGLSFVKFHTLSGDVENVKSEPEVSKAVKDAGKEERKTFGGFKLKDEKSDADLFRPGMQMTMAKKENLNTSKDGMRNMSSEARIQQERDKNEIQRRSRSPVRTKIEEKRRKVDKPATSTPAKTTPVKFDDLKRKKVNTQPPKNTTSTKYKKKIARPFDRILNGVVFAISGFQNPLRSQIREKALRMGAQYRKDWTPDSTHLICAFPHTPKFRQVMIAGGKIVRKEWIEDCASKRALISWKKYNMDPNPPDDSSSEGEEEDVSADGTHEEEERMVVENTEEDPYGASTDEEGGDTEDEIEKIQTHGGKDEKVDENPPQDDDDVYNASTDEECGNFDDKLPHLPDYFANKEFLLYGDFRSDTRRILQRHIIACGGKIVDYMGDDVEYVITEQNWDENFEEALGSNAGLVFVKPAWVIQCSLQERIIPYQPYVVSAT